MKPTMTDIKELPSAVESPTYIVTAASSERKKGGITKKQVLFAGIGVLVVAIILVAILVGIYLFGQAQKEIIQFTMNYKGSNNENVKQDVLSDPNDNVVLYHVTKGGQDAYIVNDFNRGMQIVKVIRDDRVDCYVTALNTSASLDTSAITGPESMKDKGESEAASFAIFDDPVVDRSFLPKKAQDLCQNVGLYWVAKNCGTQPTAEPSTGQNNTDTIGDRVKRRTYLAGYYRGLACVAGCCYKHCACYVSITDWWSGGKHYCYVYYRTGTCCSSTSYCYYHYKFYNSNYCY